MTGPQILFAHGAGLGSTTPWMQGWTARLGQIGPTRAFDYPYMAAGKRRPDRLPTLIEAHTDALEPLLRDGPVVLAGKSMGSRVGCHVAVAQHAAGRPVSALICLGYPLVSSGKRRAVRDAVLLKLRTPILFVQGTRDAMCPLDHLEAVRARMQCPSAVHVVQTGDHSLRVTKTWAKQSGQDQDAVDAAMADAVRRFVGTFPV